MDVLDLALKEQELIVEIRRYLHENPELSGNEENTVAYIMRKLKEFGVPCLSVPQGGVLGFIGGNEQSKTVLLRADIDALPIQESDHNASRKKTCVSKIPGVAHMCGHDSHTAMLLAAAKILCQYQDELPGRVLLFFERAEEGGGNILYLLQYIYEQKIRVDGCYAIHVNMELPAGQIAAEYGSINAGGVGFEVRIYGKGGHGARPHLASNPINCFNALYNAISQIPVNCVPGDEGFVWSICKIVAGEKRNVIPEYLDFAGTARYYDREKAGVVFKEKFIQLLDSVTKMYGCSYEITYMVGPTLVTVNEKHCTDIARGAIAKYLGPARLGSVKRKMGSESFSAALTLWPGCYCQLGNLNPAKGITASGHHPDFDVDEDILYLGTATAVGYAVDFLACREEIPFAGWDKSPKELYEYISYPVRGF